MSKRGRAEAMKPQSSFGSVTQRRTLINHGQQWGFNGVSMGFQWGFNGVLMGFQWGFNGVLMGFSGVSMGF